MRRILIVSTVSKQFYLFEPGNIEVLKSLGFEVHAAANFSDASERLDGLDIVKHHFDIQRSPFSCKNIKAYFQLRKIMKSQTFDAVHCHSPMGGVLARLAARKAGINTVIYTAHGFHFFDGAPLVNWVVYYAIEKWLSRYTTLIITINKEDYDRASSFRTCHVEFVPGVGIDLDHEAVAHPDFVRRKKRMELSIQDDTFLIMSVGELNRNKNHESIIRALAEIPNERFLYIICGDGDLRAELLSLIDSLNLSDKVRLLGFRDDVRDLCAASDLFVFPSFREGLSVALMEAMAAGMPIIASRIRGNIDLIESGVNGILVEPNDCDGYALAIEFMIKHPNVRGEMKHSNQIKIQKYSRKYVKERMTDIYRRYMVGSSLM